MRESLAENPYNPTCDLRGTLAVTVKVRLFARMAQEAKASLISLEVSEGATAGAARTALQKNCCEPGIRFA
jgi:hypothetical protein